MRTSRTTWLVGLVWRIVRLALIVAAVIGSLELSSRFASIKVVAWGITLLTITLFGFALASIRKHLDAVQLERVRLRSVVLLSAFVVTAIGISLFVATPGGNNVRFVALTVAMLGISHLLNEYRSIRIRRRARAILLGILCVFLSVGGVYWQSSHPATGLLVAFTGAFFGYFGLVSATEHMRSWFRLDASVVTAMEDADRDDGGLTQRSHDRPATPSESIGAIAERSRTWLFSGLGLLVLSALVFNIQDAGHWGTFAILAVIVAVYSTISKSDSDLMIVVLMFVIWWATAPTTTNVAEELLPIPRAETAEQTTDSDSEAAVRAETTESEAENNGVLLVFGDSFISGEGADEYITGTNERGRNECRRADTTHHHLLAAASAHPTEKKRVGPSGTAAHWWERLAQEQIDRIDAFPPTVISVACSGAVAAHITSEAQFASQPRLRPTDDPVPSDLSQLLLAKAYLSTTAPDTNVEMIMLSIGGNDALFSTLVTSCFAPGDCSDIGHYFIDQLDKFDPLDPEAEPPAGTDDPSMPPDEQRSADRDTSVLDAYAGIQQFADEHDAEVLVIPYPQPLRETACRLPLTDAEHVFINEFVRQLNEKLRILANEHGFHFVDTAQTALADPKHRLCDKGWDRNGGLNFIEAFPVDGDLTSRLNPLSWVHNSVHPNDQGHRDIAAAILNFDLATSIARNNAIKLDEDLSRLDTLQEVALPSACTPPTNLVRSEGDTADSSLDSSRKETANLPLCYGPQVCAHVARAGSSIATSAEVATATTTRASDANDGCITECDNVLKERENAAMFQDECPGRWTLLRLRATTATFYPALLLAAVGAWMTGVWALAAKDSRRFFETRPADPDGRQRPPTSPKTQILQHWITGGIASVVNGVKKISSWVVNGVKKISSWALNGMEKVIDRGLFSAATVVLLGLIVAERPGTPWWFGTAALLQAIVGLRWLLLKLADSQEANQMEDPYDGAASSLELLTTNRRRDPFQGELRYWERIFREFRYPLLGWIGVLLFVAVVLLRADGEVFVGLALGAAFALLLGAALFPMVVSRPKQRSSQVALLAGVIALALASGVIWPLASRIADDADRGTIARDLPLLPGGLLALALIVGGSIVDGAIRRPEDVNSHTPFIRGITTWFTELGTKRVAELHSAQTTTAAGLLVAAIAVKQLDGPPAYAMFGLVVVGIIVNWWASFMGHSGRLWPFATVSVFVGIVAVELLWSGGWLTLGRLGMALVAIYAIARVFSARTLRFMTVLILTMMAIGLYISGTNSVSAAAPPDEPADEVAGLVVAAEADPTASNPTAPESPTEATPQTPTEPPDTEPPDSEPAQDGTQQAGTTEQTTGDVTNEDDAETPDAEDAPDSVIDALQAGLNSAWRQIFESLGINNPPTPGRVSLLFIALLLVFAYRWVETVNSRQTLAPIKVEAFTAPATFKDGQALTSQLQSELARAGITDPPFVPSGGLSTEVLGLFEKVDPSAWTKVLSTFSTLARPKRGTIVTPALELKTKDHAIVTIRVKNARTERIRYAASFHAESDRNAVRKAVAYIARNTLTMSKTTPAWARWESEDGLALRYYLESRSDSHYGTPITLEERVDKLRTSISASPSTGLVRVELGHAYELLGKPWQALRIQLEAAENHPRLVSAHYRSAAALSMLAGELLNGRTTLDKAVANDRLMIANSLLVVLDRHTNNDHPYFDTTTIARMTNRHTADERRLAFSFLDAADDIVSGVLRINSTPVLLLNALVHQDERAHWTAIIRDNEARRHENGRYLVLRELIRVRRLLALATYPDLAAAQRGDEQDLSAVEQARLRALVAARRTFQDIERLVADYEGAGTLYNQACALALYAGVLEENPRVFQPLLMSLNNEPSQGAGNSAGAPLVALHAEVKAFKQKAVEVLFAARAHSRGQFPALTWIEQDPDLRSLSDTGLFHQLAAWMGRGEHAVSEARKVDQLA